MFQWPRLENWRDALALCLLLVGLLQLGNAGVIEAKALLAQHLIGRAWHEGLTSGEPVLKPWPWADTRPVARLAVPSLGVDLLVLEGATGHALAFGPGHESASATPGRPGTVVIGGHRDTHFAFLETLEPGTPLSLQLPGGGHRDYLVASARVVDTRREPQLKALPASDVLLLVTCYPFDALRPGGPLRYVVTARPLADDGRAPGAVISPIESGVYEL